MPLKKLRLVSLRPVRKMTRMAQKISGLKLRNLRKKKANTTPAAVAHAALHGVYAAFFSKGKIARREQKIRRKKARCRCHPLQ